MARLLIDTNILIDLLRRQAPAVSFIAGLTAKPTLSAVTVAELFSGFRDAAERSAIDSILHGATVIPIDEEIAEQGGLLRRQWMRSHGLDIADALIAATAMAHGLRLATRNRKHFPMLENLLVPY